MRTILRWARQIAQALHHIHSRGVFQVDIGTYNVLLDWNEDVKLCDFAGSSLDGSEPTVAPGAHSMHPRISITHPSIRSELFAVGSMLYEIETTYEPYNDKNDGELEELFGADQYPEVAYWALGEVITKCWTGQYADSGKIVIDIGQIEIGQSYRATRHADLRLEQWLLEENLHPRLADFSGSRFDERPDLGLESAAAASLECISHRLPRDFDEDSTIISDLFALGSTLYELVAGSRPYEGKKDDVIEAHFMNHEYPSTEDVLLGDIINKPLTEAERAKALAESDAKVAKMTQEELEAMFPQYKNYKPEAVDADEVFAWLMDEYGSI
ncbi:serine/threonine protein kinase [Fusarium austroafricanum]|uniref:Serine/threonine protein kinase n=1 Tax=Fusarium austroafricanum TaxID=2364996 RepID=A0A8H4NWK1_9HYPO|nr:serine/threonine protein kinase [Fusarium austroafricanum]